MRLSERMGNVLYDAVTVLIGAGIILGYVLGVATPIAGLFLGVRQFAHHYDVADCRNFAAQSGYETKFAQYTWITWDCLAKTDNGKWVSTKNLHGVNQ